MAQADGTYSEVTTETSTATPSAPSETTTTSTTTTTTASLFLPDSVPNEFKDDSFLSGIRSAKQTLGAVETGLSAKSEFELYFQTGATVLDLPTLQKRAQNVDIRYSKIRSVYWKVFLNVVGTDTASWSSILTTKRHNYDKLKAKYITDAMSSEDDASNLMIDNPLLSASGGKWDNYYRDTQLKDTITLDVDRTYPEDEFFLNRIVQNSLSDILFIYSKENEWISYKQGMNEIIATLFMVNTVQSTISPYVDDDSKIHPHSDTDTAVTAQNQNEILWERVQDIRYIEHDTYYMFTEIMSIMGQYFINAAQKDIPPVVERSKRIQGQFLRQMDTQLAQHLLKINLTPQLYGLRWIRLFFSREFHLRDVCVVWDAIFAVYSQRKQEKSSAESKMKQKAATDAKSSPAMDPIKAIDNALEKPRKVVLDFRFVDYMSCSMLLFIRHQLIGRDISHCLRRVMRYPPIEDIASLIERAYTIRDQIERKGKKNPRSKTAIAGNLNIADRWNQFSRTVTSAMTTYAEDVKNLMGGQRRTLKSRMQFEYALGTKMGQILNGVQLTINTHRTELNNAFLPQSSNNSTRNSDKQDIEEEEENEILNDPLTMALDNPLAALNGPTEKAPLQPADHTFNEPEENKEEDNPLLIIEEALAELKLVKDALLGNLDETQLELWLNWTFVEPSPEPLPKSNAPRRRKPAPPSAHNANAHRRNLSSSGLPPPKKAIKNRKSPNLKYVQAHSTHSALPQHPLD